MPIIIFIISFFYFLPLYAASFTLESKGGAALNVKEKTMMAQKDVKITIDDYILTADQSEVFYVDFNNLQNNLRKQSLQNFKRIEATTNVRVHYFNHLLTGDELVYDVKKHIMVLRAKGNPTVYKNGNINITAQERIEFQDNEHIVVARGKPKIIVEKKSASDIGYTITADLFVAKIRNDLKEVEYVEALNKVRLRTTDGTFIKGDYAFYNKVDNQMSVEDNVSLSKNGSTLSGCKIIFDLQTGQSLLVPCSEQENFSTTIINKDKKG